MCVCVCVCVCVYVGWNDEVKAAIKRKEAVLGRGCWQLAMKRQRKDVW